MPRLSAVGISGLQAGGGVNAVRSKGRKLVGLLRLLLASLVMTSHLGITFGGLNPGVGAVIVFYLLAGHVVSQLWRKRPAEAALQSALWFYRDRLWRILPQYLVAMAFAALLWWFGAESPFLAREPQVQDWLANLLVIPLNYYMYSGQDAFTLVPPAWSLAVELQFYLLVPWLLGRPRWMAGAAVLSLLVFILAQGNWLNTDIFGYRLLAGVGFVFLAGTLLGERLPLASRLLAALWLASVFYVVWLLGWGDHVPYNLEVALGLALGLPVLLLLQRQSLDDRWQTLQRRAGELSYGLFLMHFPVMWLLRLAGFQGPETLWAVGGLSAVLAWLVHRYIERPLWRRFRPRLPSSAPGAAAQEGRVANCPASAVRP